MPQRARATRIYDITARMLLAVVGDGLEVMRLSYPGADVIDFLICAAALIGYIESRPMSAGKLAAFSGIPRPTVVRRVKALIKHRLLEMPRGGKAISTPKHILIGQVPDKLSARYSQAVRNAAAELSKMDT